MLKTISITSNGQITIPLDIRKTLGITRGTLLNIETNQREIILRPVKSKIWKLAGKYRQEYKKNPIDVDNIRDFINYSS